MDGTRRDRDPWEAATWEGAADATLMMGASLTLSERLDWLEEMGRLAEHLQRQRRPKASGSPDPAAPRDAGR